jgi:FtsZ-interacting cell division protein ZipA
LVRNVATNINIQVLVEILLLSGGTPFANFKDLAHAWGRDKGFHTALAHSVFERRGDMERKRRRPNKIGNNNNSNNNNNNNKVVPKQTCSGAATNTRKKQWSAASATTVTTKGTADRAAKGKPPQRVRLATAAVAKISYPQLQPPHPSSPPLPPEQQQQQQQHYQSQSPTSQQQQHYQELPAAQYDYCRPIVEPAHEVVVDDDNNNEEDEEEPPPPLDETALHIIVTAMSEGVGATQPI